MYAHVSVVNTFENHSHTDDTESQISQKSSLEGANKGKIKLVAVSSPVEPHRRGATEER